jgi:protein phosphatase
MSSGTLAAEETIHLVARNLITRAVGVSDGLELDEETIEVQDGDIYLLCSDGLSNEVDEQDIRNALAVRDCRQSADALIDMALQNGGRDNVSAVVVRAMDLFSTEKTVLNPAVRS